MSIKINLKELLYVFVMIFMILSYIFHNLSTIFLYTKIHKSSTEAFHPAEPDAVHKTRNVS